MPLTNDYLIVPGNRDFQRGLLFFAALTGTTGTELESANVVLAMLVVLAPPLSSTEVFGQSWRSAALIIEVLACALVLTAKPK